MNVKQIRNVITTVISILVITGFYFYCDDNQNLQKTLLVYGYLVFCYLGIYLGYVFNTISKYMFGTVCLLTNILTSLLYFPLFHYTQSLFGSFVMGFFVLMLPIGFCFGFLLFLRGMIGEEYLSFVGNLSIFKQKHRDAIIGIVELQYKNLY
jgi:hypothetical protein